MSAVQLPQTALSRQLSDHGKALLAGALGGGGGGGGGAGGARLTAADGAHLTAADSGGAASIPHAEKAVCSMQAFQKARKALGQDEPAHPKDLVGHLLKVRQGS